VEYIFCHIPKTGGISINSTLGLPINGHKVVNKRKHQNSFVFSFVRNPYDRFLSCFRFLKNGGCNNYDLKDKRFFLRNYELEDFIKENLLFASKYQKHFKPQSFWLPNGADFIGRFENLQEDFNKLMEFLKMEKKQLPVMNATKKNDYQLTKKDKNIIYKIYKKDFIKFNYER
jgi:hypothetical protein